MIKIANNFYKIYVKLSNILVLGQKILIMEISKTVRAVT